MTEEIKNKTTDTELTDNDIETIVEAAESSNDGKMEALKETVQVDPNAPLEAVSVEQDLSDNSIGVIPKETEDLDISLFDVNNDEEYQKHVEEKTLSTAKGALNLSDEDAYDFIKLVSEFKKNPNMKVYDRLPATLKLMVDKMMADAKIPKENKEMVSRFMLNEFASSAEVEAAFVDFEKSLNEALNMPSIVDMYTEHTRDVMEKNIPAMIEKIKDEEPEKAEMLAKVKDAFTRSYTLETAMNMYENNTSIRKDVRRYDLEFKRCLDNFNFMNKDTRFKMHDVRELPEVLTKILINDPKMYADGYMGGTTPEYIQSLLDLAVTDVDIKKLCILLTVTCRGLKADDIIDAAYMYYMLKNIIMLKHTQEAKTEFAAELISNICKAIVLIRNKEAEFYEANPHLDKSKSAKKSHSTSNRKK